MPLGHLRVADFAQKVKFETSLCFEVSAVRLMRSQLTHTGPVYSELAVVKLGFPQHDTGTSR